jgi:hypothetical protein
MVEWESGTMKPKQKTRAELQREVRELKAQLASTAHFAAEELKKLGPDRVMGSGIIVEMSTLGNRVTVGPFCIRDGFSKTTIDALIADLIRSYELATAFRPKP